MTREHKLALIIGFAVVLLVGVLVSDHFSQARRDRPGLDLTPGHAAAFGAAAPVLVSSTPSVSAGGSSVGLGGGGVATPVSGSGDGVGGGFGLVVDDGRLRAGDGGGVEAGGRRTASSVLTRDQVAFIHQPVEIEMGFTTSRRVQNPSDAFAIGGWESAGSNGDVKRATNGAEHGNGAAGRSSGGTGVRLAYDPLGGGSSAVATPRRHEVQPMETLSQIARRYYGRDSAWREIAKANPGRVDADGNVRAGVTLIIPALESVGSPVVGGQGAGNGSGTRSGPTPSPATVSPAAQPAVGPTRSPVSRPATLPSRSGSSGTAVASGGAVSSDASRDGVRFHTVQRGEVLGTISQNLLGTSRRYREIVALNADVIRDPDHVPAGTRLRIPAR